MNKEGMEPVPGGGRKARHIVVIGGGISGLSSAFYLLRRAREHGLEATVIVVDPAPAAGGKISTLRRGGFVIERGPDSFLARKQPIIDLTKELGLEHELVAQNPGGKKSYIVRNGKLHPLPPGLLLGVPTELKPFVRSGLLSPGGKLRALLDVVLPARKGMDDESIGEFLERRVGREVTDRIAEPLLAGIYAGELRKLSLRATFPQFRQAELKHGSLIRGMRRQRKAGAGVSAAPADVPDAVKGSMFLSFRGGLSQLVEGLVGALKAEGADVRYGRKAAAIRRADGGGSGPGDAADGLRGTRYVVELDDGTAVSADAVIVTTPAYDAADLLAPHIDVEELRGIRYVSVANVVLAYDRKTFGRSFDGSGFLVPRSEGRHITACTWTSTKWLHTSPDDKVLLRCYVGRAGDEASVDLPDEALKEAVRKDIRELLGIDAEPLFAEITRLHRSMPQYPVGHVERCAAFKSRLSAALPGVRITGAAFEGVGLPDCIRMGRDTAVETLKELQGHQGLR